MLKKSKVRQVNVGHANGNGQVKAERAESDGTWRNRPVWRFMRPDHKYGPKLTLAARMLLAEERQHVTNNRD